MTLSLKEDDNWKAAAERYAAEHNRYYQALNLIERWMTKYFFGDGPEIGQFRGRAEQLWAEKRGPDIIGLGPDSPPEQLALLHLPVNER